MFWIWMVLAFAAIIGLSVLIGKALTPRPGSGGSSTTQQERITALKASGALKYRKSNRD